jgi:hypothetical protein
MISLRLKQVMWTGAVKLNREMKRKASFRLYHPPCLAKPLPPVRFYRPLTRLQPPGRCKRVLAYTAPAAIVRLYVISKMYIQPH